MAAQIVDEELVGLLLLEEPGGPLGGLVRELPADLEPRRPASSGQPPH